MSEKETPLLVRLKVLFHHKGGKWPAEATLAFQMSPPLIPRIGEEIYLSVTRPTDDAEFLTITGGGPEIGDGGACCCWHIEADAYPGDCVLALGRTPVEALSAAAEFAAFYSVALSAESSDYYPPWNDEYAPRRLEPQARGEK